MENSQIPPMGNTGARIYNSNNLNYEFGYFNPENKISYSIDWITLVTTKIQFGLDGEPINTSIPIINELLKVLKSYYNYFDLKMEYSGKRYRSKIVVSPGIIIFFNGSPDKRGDPTSMIEISGEGCDKFNSFNDWYLLVKFCIEELNCKCTRLDVAIDDYYGEQINYNEFFDLIKDDMYTRTGTPRNKIDWHNNSLKTYDLGCTVTFYSTSSNINLVSYNKMAEQIDKNNPIPNSPQWLRHEMRFTKEQGDVQLRVFYECLLKEVNGEISDNSTSFSKYASSALYTCLKLYSKKDGTNPDRWIEHPGWLNLIGDISDIKFIRPKTKTSNLFKRMIHFTESYSRFLLQMYLLFGQEYFNLWIKNIMYKNKKRLEAKDFIEVNDLRNSLDLPFISLFSINNQVSDLAITNEKEIEVINKYYLPTHKDYIAYEDGEILADDIKKLIEAGDDNFYEDSIDKIMKQIEKLQKLIGEFDE